MYCPIHNPSGGVYDPTKVQFKKRRHALKQEYGKGSVTTISTERIPVLPKPFVPPLMVSPTAPGVAQLDNMKKITTDYAAITMAIGSASANTYIFNIKLLPSNSPARQIVTALLYASNGQLYNRFDTWVKQRRAGTNWANATAVGSVDIVRCYDEGRQHTPPSPGPVLSQSMWEDTIMQAVTSQFAYITGYAGPMQLQTLDKPFAYVQAQVMIESERLGLTLAERSILLQSRIDAMQAEYVSTRDTITDIPVDFNITISPLDLIGKPLIWVGGNAAGDGFINNANTSDLKDWFMHSDEMHIPNKQMYSDRGYAFADTRLDGTIEIKSNSGFQMTPINEEKLYFESQGDSSTRYTSW